MRHWNPRKEFDVEEALDPPPVKVSYEGSIDLNTFSSTHVPIKDVPTSTQKRDEQVSIESIRIT